MALKLCKDCWHVDRDYLRSMHPDYIACLHTDALEKPARMHLVSGEWLTIERKRARWMREHGPCGAKGRLFEEREP